MDQVLISASQFHVVATPSVNMVRAGMRTIQKSPRTSFETNTSTLDDMQASQKTTKYVPRVEVVKSYDLTRAQRIKWFVDTYDHEGEYQDDLRLYVGTKDKKYGNIGVIVNAKEDVNEEATPCITITVLPKGEISKANNISLILENWAVFDMTGSKAGKENSFVKLGINISSFTSVHDSGVDNLSQIVKAIKNAKGVLSFGRKVVGRKKTKNPPKKRAVESQGREIVKSDIEELSGGNVGSSSPQLQQQFRSKRLKVLLNCPPKISREISKEAYLSATKSMQIESFLDQLVQARLQWKENGSPQRPPPSLNKSKNPDSKSWEDFVETTDYTFQKGFVKNVLHLLLCEDEIWNNWVFIMDQYMRGGLPNTKGEIIAPSAAEQRKRILTVKRGEIQQAPDIATLGPTLFRSVSGLDKGEVYMLQQALINKSILLKKGKQTKGMTDMEEFAWKLKVDRVLKAAIVDLFNNLTMERMNWNDTCKKYKLGEYEYNQLTSYTEAFVKDSLNRTKKKPSLPKSATTLLNHLYRASMGLGTKENPIPWIIKPVGLEIGKLEDFCQQVHVPVRLAIMDARGIPYGLSASTFSSITNCLGTLNSHLEYILVCFLDFINIGYLVEGVCTQSAKVHYEVGTITKDSKQSLTAGSVAYASVVLFISKVDTFESIDKKFGERVSISSSTITKGDTIDKDFIHHLIEGFSLEQSYVLDIFSGGIVLEQSVLSKRRCISLCKDELEAMTLEAKCSQILEDNQDLQEWCGAQSVLNKQMIELDDVERNTLDDMEIDEQPCDVNNEDDDEERENESVYGVDQSMQK